ncbi:MAG: hypothetical protein ACYC0H_15590, partial [Solirubrobacteraceae bacterium]
VQRQDVEMGTERNPGPSSIAGLRWLARVGPGPLEAWQCAMGWSSSVAKSHARRLERYGWIERHRMTRGRGSLLLATRRGVRICELEVTPAAAPQPTSWAHDCACAWTAAWLSVRGRDWLGPREVLADATLKGVVEWRTGAGTRHVGHRPDLAVRIPAGTVAVEVELQRKANKRLAAVLSLYGRWLAESRITGVIYVCASSAGAERITAFADDVGLPADAVRTELLSIVRDQAGGADS